MVYCYDMIYQDSIIHQNPIQQSSVPFLHLLFLKIQWLVSINSNGEFRRFSSLHKILPEGEYTLHCLSLVSKQR